jgi:hypothetical protein
MTKLQTILLDRNLLQGDLIRLIKNKSGFKIGRDRISKICSGTLQKYNIETAVMISEALDVPLQDIVELSNVKKENTVKMNKCFLCDNIFTEKAGKKFCSLRCCDKYHTNKKREKKKQQND